LFSAMEFISSVDTLNTSVYRKEKVVFEKRRVWHL